jgi:hypothetical protein
VVVSKLALADGCGFGLATELRAKHAVRIVLLVGEEALGEERRPEDRARVELGDPVPVALLVRTVESLLVRGPAIKAG